MLTYMFPGQGSQVRGMGEALFEEFPDIIQQVDHTLGYSIKALCLSDPERQLHQTQYTQPALYVVNALSYRKKINEVAQLPDFLIGHSLGEYNALEAAGAIDFEDGLKLVKKRGELMSRAEPGAMAAVLGLTAEAIQQVLDGNDLTGIDIANYNSPYQVVLSGLQNDIRRAEPFFAGENIKYLPINARGAFHSRYMASSRTEFEAYLQSFTFSAPAIPVVSNAYARFYRQTDITQNLADQITHSVKWLESIRYLMGKAVVAEQEMIFEELGVGQVLTKMMRHIQEQATPLVVEEASQNGDGQSVAELEDISLSTGDTAEEAGTGYQTADSNADSTVMDDVTDNVEAADQMDWKQRTEALQEKVGNWNDTYPIGIKVRVKGHDDELETRTEAMILFGHRAAIYMQGYNGYFELDEVTPV